MVVLPISSCLVVVLSLVSLCFLHALPTAGRTLGFSTKLIHRDSPESSLYDPTSTPFSRFRVAVHRSVGRANYFNNITCSANSCLLKAVDGISSDVINYDGHYLLELYMGSPAKHRQKVQALVDTGSGLNCVYCRPCKKCPKHKEPIFDPKASKTYMEILCKSYVCSLFQHSPCKANSPCKFRITYIQGLSARGLVFRETLGFDGKNSVRVPGIILGCIHHTTGQTFSNAIIGIIGFNAGNLSLIRQLNSTIGIFNMFSYCLPKDYRKSSRVYFGLAAHVSNPRAITIPLFIGDNFYYIDLKEIVIVGHMVRPLHFAMKQEKGPHSRHDGNFMIDSGTALTFVPELAMTSLSMELAEVFPRPRVEAPDYLDLCFNWSEPIEERWMPSIIFKFSSGAELEVTQPFELIEEDILCLTVASDRHTNGRTILGNRAHLTYRTVYDLDGGELTFLPNDC